MKICVCVCVCDLQINSLIAVNSCVWYQPNWPEVTETGRSSDPNAQSPNTRRHWELQTSSHYYHLCHQQRSDTSHRFCQLAKPCLVTFVHFLFNPFCFLKTFCNNFHLLCNIPSSSSLIFLTGVVTRSPLLAYDPGKVQRWSIAPAVPTRGPRPEQTHKLLRG